MKDDAEPGIGASVAKAIAVKRSEENTRWNLATPDRRNYAAGLLVRQPEGVHEMLGIEKVDHIGIRVSDKSVSIAFYERLGFRTLSDFGFEKGHPIIMQHPSGVVLNLLGPANMPNDKNILMDVDEKYRHRSKCGNSSLHTRAGLSRGPQCSGSGVSNDARARQRPWISAVLARADSRAA